MDLIADSLTRIRNTICSHQVRVHLTHSRVVERIVEIMQEEGFVRKYHVLTANDGPQKEIRVFLRKDPALGYAIQECKRVSKGKRRVYVGHKALPKIKNGLGVAIISTSKGIMTAEKAQKAQIGGEVLCSIF